MSRARFAVVVAAVSLSCAVEGPTGPGIATGESSLTVAQCEYFLEAGRVTICHFTGSARNPYLIMKANAHACAGHAGHASDFVAFDDPTCNGSGCLPDGAPSDGTVECCDGLSLQADGTCGQGIVTCVASGGACDPAVGCCSGTCGDDLTCP